MTAADAARQVLEVQEKATPLPWTMGDTPYYPITSADDRPIHAQWFRRDVEYIVACCNLAPILARHVLSQAADAPPQPSEKPVVHYANLRCDEKTQAGFHFTAIRENVTCPRCLERLLPSDARTPAPAEATPPQSDPIDEMARRAVEPLIESLRKELASIKVMKLVPQAECDALRQRVAELEAGLQPFAKLADTFSAEHDSEAPLTGYVLIDVNIGDCRRARSLLSGENGEKPVVHLARTFTDAWCGNTTGRHSAYPSEATCRACLAKLFVSGEKGGTTCEK